MTLPKMNTNTNAVPGPIPGVRSGNTFEGGAPSKSKSNGLGNTNSLNDTFTYEPVQSDEKTSPWPVGGAGSHYGGK